MKKINFAVCFFAILVLSCGTARIFAQQRYHQLSVGSELPGAIKAKVLPAVNAEPISLEKAMTSKGLLIMFSCNTCPFVVRSQQRTKEIMQYAREKGIGMVIVNSNEAQRDDADSDPAMRKYAAAQEYTVPYVIDKQSALANVMGATHTPEVFLFNGAGKLVYAGAMEDNPANPSESKRMYLKDAIDAMLQGKMPIVTNTKSIGCSIKRNS